MIAAFSIVSFASGSALSCFAQRLPMARATAEFIGGVLLIFALVLIGVGLAPHCR